MSADPPKDPPDPQKPDPTPGQPGGGTPPKPDPAPAPPGGQVPAPDGTPASGQGGDTKKPRDADVQFKNVGYGAPRSGATQIEAWLQPRRAKPRHITTQPTGIETLVEALLAWPVIFISSEDEDWLDATGYEVVGHVDFANTHQWLLEGNKVQLSADFSLLLRELPALKAPPGKEKSSPLLLIKATLPQFFGGILADLGCLNNQIEYLREHKSYIVCLVYPQARVGVPIPPNKSAFRHFPVTPDRSGAHGSHTVPDAPLPPFGEIVDDGHYVERAALFTTAFLGELSRRDFLKVMEVLLDDEQVTEQRTTRVTHTPDGKKEEEFTHIPIEAEKLWRDRMAGIHKKLGISPRQNGGVQVVGFVAPNFEKAAHEAFWRHLDGPRSFFAKLCGTLLSDSGISDELQSRLTQLALEMAIADSDQFGVDWLESLIDAFVRAESLTLAQPQGNVLLEKILELVQADTRDRFYTRLGLLCAALCSEDETYQSVEQLLHRLLAQAQHDPVYELVVRLRAVPRIDYFRWLRRLLDEGPAEVKREVLQHLVYQAAISPERCALILKSTHPWLPAPDYAGRLTQAQEYTLPFPIALIMHLDEISRRKREEGLPMRFPFPSQQDDAECARVLADWLVHGRLAAGLESLAGEEVPAAEPFIADTLEAVAMMAENLSADDASRQEGLALRDLIRTRTTATMARARTTNPPRWLNICARWEARSTLLKALLFSLPMERPFKNQRERLRQSLQTLHHLRSSRSETSTPQT